MPCASLQLLGEGTPAPATVAVPAPHPALVLESPSHPKGTAIPATSPSVSSPPLSAPLAASARGTLSSGARSSGTLVGSAPAQALGAATKPGPIQVAAQIVKGQGYSGLFSGVSATALRQVCTVLYGLQYVFYCVHHVGQFCVT